jgi:hypothetical protein
MPESKSAIVRALSAGFVVLLASAYSTEFYLRQSSLAFIRPMQPITSFPKSEKSKMAAMIRKEYGIAFDVRDPGEIIADLRKQGIAAVPQTILPTPGNNKAAQIEPQLVPLSGIGNTVTVVCNQNGQYLIYKSDEHGFHNVTQSWRSDRIEIAAVGNSWTLGYCVPSDKNFVSLIRRVYPATLNLGMPNEGPLHILGVLNEYVSAVQPRVVLWFYSEGSSLVELTDERRSDFLFRYLKGDFVQGLFHRQSEIDAVARDYIDRQTGPDTNTAPTPQQRHAGLLDNLREVAKLGALRLKLGIVRGTAVIDSEKSSESELSTSSGEINLLREIFSEAKARVREWEGRLYVVYLPSPDRYFGISTPSASKRTQILNALSSLDIPVIDVQPVFQAHPDPQSLFPFRRPGHANEQGHRLVAETVLNAISGRKSPSATSRVQP